MENLGVVSLLRAVWFLSTLPIVVAWFPLPGLGWLHNALLGFVKRGKILQSNNKLTVPQRFFSHLYVVAILWTTMLLVVVWFYAVTSSLNDDQHVWVSVFMLLLMETHVLRRFYESVNVFNYSPSARMHIVLYISGIIYYIATPLSLCCNIAPQVLEHNLLFLKNNNNNVTMDTTTTDDQFNTAIISLIVTPLLSLGWSAYIGAAIFFWGWLHQLRCHQILGSLRKKSGKLEEYVIPYGDWFEYVSSPHYTAEIVIYGGLVVACGGRDLTLWLLFALVVANLGFAATITHRWYLHKFDNYPRDRRAIFPFLY